MVFLKGQTVKLHTKIESGTNPFGEKTYSEEVVDVENVIISPTSDADIVNEIQVYGKASIYTLSIPKGDSHNWEDTIVEFFGAKWRTFGNVTMLQEELVPLQWNGKVRVLKECQV